ncbi:MAG: epimerase [Candidatus Bathyarchaeum sp.]|nr:MAG: epimerase [Candidatus Bathyarchaeum sp.]
MKILVTGGAGYIGSVLVPELLKAGHEVTVLDNLTWGIQGLTVNLSNPNFSFVKGDIRDEKTIKGLLQNKDAVVHLAAIVGCGLCDSNKKHATDVNVNGTINISNHLSDNQLLILASTGSIYGRANVSSLTEKVTPNPQSHYGRTKLEAEKTVSKTKNVVILRFATVFGASHRMRLDLLVNQFVYEAIKKKTLVVYGKNYVRSIIHVQDIAQGIMFAVQNKESMQGQTFNLSSSELTFTKEQIAQRIKRQVDYDLQFAELKSNSDGSNYQFSTQKIEALGYRTKVTLDEGIMELICAIKNMKTDVTNFNCYAPQTVIEIA